MSTQILWFATRGAGIVSLILFSAVACLGLLAVARTQSARWPRFLTVELHRNLALLSVAFLAIHIVTAVLDPFTKLGISAALVPLASTYRSLPVAFGVVSVDLVAAVIVTSLIRERIGHRAWRAVHWASYASWPLAIEHTLTAGSDSFSVWLLAVRGLWARARESVRQRTTITGIAYDGPATRTRWRRLEDVDERSPVPLARRSDARRRRGRPRGALERGPLAHPHRLGAARDPDGRDRAPGVHRDGDRGAGGRRLVLRRTGHRLGPEPGGARCRIGVRRAHRVGHPGGSQRALDSAAGRLAAISNGGASRAWRSAARGAQGGSRR